MTGSTSSINDTQRSDLKQKLALFLGAPTTAVSLTFQDVAASDSASDEGSAQGDTGLSRRMAAANEPVLSVQSTVEEPAASNRTVADMYAALHQSSNGQSATELLGWALGVEMRGEVRSELSSRLRTEAEYAQSVEEQQQALSGVGDQGEGGGVSAAAFALALAVAACNCLVLAAVAYRLLRLRKGKVVLATRASIDPSQQQANRQAASADAVDVELDILRLAREDTSSSESDWFNEEVLHHTGEIVYGKSADGSLWLAELKTPLVRLTDLTTQPPTIRYKDERARVRYFGPTAALHTSPAAMIFWQEQVAPAMSLPADADAFRLAAQARAAASAGVHFSYFRDGAQRSATIFGGLGNVCEQRFSGKNKLVCFAADDAALRAARRHTTARSAFPRLHFAFDFFLVSSRRARGSGGHNAASAHTASRSTTRNKARSSRHGNGSSYSSYPGCDSPLSSTTARSSGSRSGGSTTTSPQLGGCGAANLARSFESNRVEEEILHHTGEIVYGKSADGSLWLAELKTPLVRLTDLTTQPPTIRYKDERARVRYFGPTAALHTSPAAMIFWQEQVAPAMSLPADADAFRLAAQARAAASAGVHFSYFRDGAQRSATIFGGLGNVCEQRFSGNKIVCFAADDAALQAARRHITRQNLEPELAAALFVTPERRSLPRVLEMAESACAESACDTMGSPYGSTGEATPAVLPGYGHGAPWVMAGDAHGDAAKLSEVDSEDEQLALAVAKSIGRLRM